MLGRNFNLAEDTIIIPHQFQASEVDYSINFVDLT